LQGYQGILPLREWLKRKRSVNQVKWYLAMVIFSPWPFKNNVTA